MSSARRSLRRLFRKLSLAIGGLLAFVGGVFCLGLFLNQSESSSGALFGHTSFVGIIAWLVITFSLFLLGWMLTRGVGYLVLSVMPRGDEGSYGRYYGDGDEAATHGEGRAAKSELQRREASSTPNPTSPLPATTTPAHLNQMMAERYSTAIQQEQSATYAKGSGKNRVKQQ